MARINCRISSATFGLPPRPRDFHRQQAKPSAMPTDHRLRLHDHQGIHDARCKPIEADNSTLSWWRKVKISASSDVLIGTTR